jgi:hypothetical protein
MNEKLDDKSTLYDAAHQMEISELGVRFLGELQHGWRFLSDFRLAADFR